MATINRSLGFCNMPFSSEALLNTLLRVRQGRVRVCPTLWSHTGYEKTWEGSDPQCVECALGLLDILNGGSSHLSLQTLVTIAKVS